jgi:hypothetical protein
MKASKSEKISIEFSTMTVFPRTAYMGKYNKELDPPTPQPHVVIYNKTN